MLLEVSIPTMKLTTSSFSQKYIYNAFKNCLDSIDKVIGIFLHPSLNRNASKISYYLKGFKKSRIAVFCPINKITRREVDIYLFIFWTF